MTSSSRVDLSYVTLAVLAGGTGQRMGIPKAYLQIGSTPVLTWLLDRLKWPGPTMLVTAPAVPHPPGADKFASHFLDPVDGLGPLRGVLTALEHLATKLVAIVTVDMPGVDQNKLAWLVEALSIRPQCDGIMCRIQCLHETRIEPFPSAFRRDAANLVTQQMELGRRSVQDLCNGPSIDAIPPPADWSADVWTNLNHPAELAAFQAAYSNRAVKESK